MSQGRSSRTTSEAPPTPNIPTTATQQAVYYRGRLEGLEASLRNRSPLSREGPHPRPLRIYQGRNIQEHTEWNAECKNEFSLCTRYFSASEERKIRWAIAYVDSKIKNRWIAHINDNYQHTTWESFAEWLLDDIEDPANRLLNVFQRYENARQRPEQSPQDFHHYLEVLENAMPARDPNILANTFFAKLLPQIQEEIARNGRIPVTREAMVALAARYFQKPSRKRPASEARPQSRGPSSQDEKRGGSSSSRGHHQDKRNRNSGRSSWSSQRGSGRGRGNLSGPNRLPVNNATCWKCGKSGHRSNNGCPENPNGERLSLQDLPYAPNDLRTGNA
jgi:hypothetical protein